MSPPTGTGPDSPSGDALETVKTLPKRPLKKAKKEHGGMSASDKGIRNIDDYSMTLNSLSFPPPTNPSAAGPAIPNRDGQNYSRTRSLR
jgi:hypothetical protein